MNRQGVFDEFETPSDEPWARHGIRSRMVKFSPTLGHIVRVGTLEEQKVSTYRLIRDAITDRRFEDAAALVEVFEHEANVVYTMLHHDIPTARGFLSERGLSDQTVAERESTILAKLVHPDGRSHRSRRLWQELHSEMAAFVRLLGTEAVGESLNQCDLVKEHWRRLHDRDCDHLAGLLNEIMSAFGEDAIRDVWMSMNQFAFAFRYSEYDVSRQPWTESLGALLYITFESGRGHLMGPERTGDVEFFEEANRWVWVWNPCGTCGRLIRGDAIEGTPPRMEPPYNWPVLGGPYDWAWGKKGASTYGVQSCIKLAQMSIDAFGYPLRVVDCPTYPDGRGNACYRYVYKDPALVPDDVYEQVGRTRPQYFGSQKDVPVTPDFEVTRSAPNP